MYVIKKKKNVIQIKMITVTRAFRLRSGLVLNYYYYYRFVRFNKILIYYNLENTSESRIFL